MDFDSNNPKIILAFIYLIDILLRNPELIYTNNMYNIKYRKNNIRLPNSTEPIHQNSE